MEDRNYNPKFYEDKELKEKCGVYQIRNLINNKVYVGSSKDLLRRYWKHKKALKTNKHFNHHLQRAYNKVNGSFIFEVIEFCPEEDQYSLEQYWIDRLKSSTYNMNPVAEEPPYEVLKKQVVCLETKIKYESVTEAANKTGLNLSHIAHCCRHKLNIAHGLHFLFKEEYESMSESEIKDYIFSTNRYTQVVCLETQERYKSIKEAAEVTGLSESRIGGCCLGQANATRGYHWVTYDKYKEMSEEEILQLLKTPEGKRRKIICLTTMKIYDSIKDAEDELRIDNSNIIRCCKCPDTYSVKGNKFMYYEDYEQMTSEDIAKFMKNNPPKQAVRLVLCVETQEIFNSLADAGKHIGRDKRGIWNCCVGKAKTAYGFHWKYVN